MSDTKPAHGHKKMLYSDTGACPNTVIGCVCWLHSKSGHTCVRHSCVRTLFVVVFFGPTRSFEKFDLGQNKLCASHRRVRKKSRCLDWMPQSHYKKCIKSHMCRTPFRAYRWHSLYQWLVAIPRCALTHMCQWSKHRKHTFTQTQTTTVSRHDSTQWQNTYSDSD